MTLETKWQYSKNKKEDVQRSVDEARMRGEDIKEVVECWLTRVNQIQYEEMALHNALEESKGSFQVGKDVNKHMIDQENQLLNEDPQISTAVSDHSSLPPILETIQMLDFQIYDSTKSAMDQIIEALKYGNKNMVGVYGIAGIGKTTLMKEVDKFFKKDWFFDQVVMVTVSQNLVLKNIQGKIAENLGLRLGEEHLSLRAKCLSERLKKEKRTLIIIDELWKPLNLQDEVGIPCGNNCKVVLMTRHLKVCNQMKTQFDVEVKNLSEGDAWVLFKRVVGDHIEDDDTVRPVAKEIVEECGGLPLAIITVGRALRGKDQSMWKDMASQLKKSSSSPSDIEGVHEKIFCSIKLSYDFLANEATKFCFLLCCMFPEDMSISEDDLLPYMVGEGVFGDTNSLKEARDKLHNHIEGLKGSYLLLDDSGRMEGCVRMHDVIRDVSIWIASKGHDFVLKSGTGLRHFPEEDRENLKKCKRLSLMQNEITKLPNRLDCSDQLLSLSLRDNRSLKEIPDEFFQGMISLKTLDLGRTKISLMPSLLSCLTDLRVLRISKSSQMTFDVSLLGKLKKLEILHLSDCNIKQLTEEIGDLTNLKSLDLSWNQGLTIAPNTLSKLSLLEELNLEESFHEWEIDERSTSAEEEEEEEDDNDDEDGILSKKAYLFEVASLCALTQLKIRVSNLKILCPNNIPLRWEKLSRFSIILGNNWESSLVSKCATQLHICGSIPPFSDCMIFLLERSEGLFLIKCPGIKYIHILSHSAIRVWNSIRILHVEKCDDVEYLLSTTTVDVDEAEEEAIPQQIIPILSSLEKLYLWSLPKLESICQYGSLPVPSEGGGGGGGGGGFFYFFNNLRFLDVYECWSIISIIPSDLLAKLPNLEQLQVRWCPETTEVFNSTGLLLDEGGHLQATTILTKLKRLHLEFLPNLRTIWEGILSPLSLLNLEEIEVRELNLKFMFSLAMAQRFHQLKQLQLEGCSNMVQIISLMEGDEEEINTSSSRLQSNYSTNNDLSSSFSSLVLLPSTPIFGNLSVTPRSP
ncbi:probable disease resistance protein At4g27220 [Macadamia integrifolia]|uniref:probable disease resistance protein At4g27220 n=1 Tax=Macadamia integrifolia TaxID=60698 RepID=UPI001C4E46A5|nr:probable disease resistance protein At4g27220 [Macadamia integrifolia]